MISRNNISSKHSRKGTDLETKAFKHFIMGGQQTPPNELDEDHSKDRLESSIKKTQQVQQLDNSAKSNSNNASNNGIKLSSIKQNLRYNDFYYRLLSLNEKISLYKQIFYNRSPRYQSMVKQNSKQMKINKLKWNEQLKRLSMDRQSTAKDLMSGTGNKKVSFSGDLENDNSSLENEAKDNFSSVEKDAYAYIKNNQNNMYKTGFVQQFNEFLEYNQKSNILNYSKEIKKAQNRDFGEHITELKKLNKSLNTYSRNKGSNERKPDFNITIKQKLRNEGSTEKQNSRNENYEQIRESKASTSQHTLPTQRSLNHDQQKQKLNKILYQQSLQEKQLHDIIFKSEKKTQNLESRLNEIFQKHGTLDILKKQSKSKLKSRNKEGVYKSSTDNQLPSIKQAYKKTPFNSTIYKQKISKQLMRSHGEGYLQLINQKKEKTHFSQAESPDQLSIMKTSILKESTQIPNVHNTHTEMIEQSHIKAKATKTSQKRNKGDFIQKIKNAHEIYHQSKPI